LTGREREDETEERRIPSSVFGKTPFQRGFWKHPGVNPCITNNILLGLRDRFQFEKCG
jgi:hypothetical protein